VREGTLRLCCNLTWPPFLPALKGYLSAHSEPAEVVWTGPPRDDACVDRPSPLCAMLRASCPTARPQETPRPATRALWPRPPVAWQADVPPDARVIMFLRQALPLMAGHQSQSGAPLPTA
jgi:hypothetical protein